MPAKNWVVIGISGVTCGGKTTLANKLKEKLAPVYVFHQDKYFYSDDSPKHIKCEGLDHNDYDILSSLDMETMFDDITKTLNGVDRCHARSLDVDGKFAVTETKFMIIEGFTVLNYKPIMEICDLRYYFVLEYDECVSRRLRREYDPPDIPGYFEQCVWPRHVEYRAQIEKDNRVKLLDATQQDSFEVVMADIQNIIQ